MKVLEFGNNMYRWYCDNQIIININWDKAMLTRIFLSYAKIAKQNPSFAFATTSKPKTGKADSPKPQSKTQPQPQAKPKSEPQVKNKSEPQVKTQSEPQKPPQSQPQSQQPPPEEPLQRRRKIDDDDYDEQQPQLQKQNRNTVGWWIYRFFFWGTFSLLSYNIYLVHTHKQKTPVEDLPGAVPGVIDVAKSMVRSVNDMLEFISEPTSKKLLFDPVHPDLHPKTLILNLTGTIIKSQYIFGKGIKTTLRPGLEQMLRRLSQKYEIVIFAQEDQYTIMSKIMKIDPKQMHIRGVLGRQAMVWKNGQFIKDLKYLNRDLKKVVVVDRTLDNVKNHPQNTIVLKQFDGDEKDNELIKLAVLLDKMADVPDVRKYLKTLGENPVETYYTRAKEIQERINKKANMFGVFAKPQ